MLVFASFMIILNQNTSLEQTVTQTRQIEQDRANEQLTITGQATYASANTVAVQVNLNNTGTLPVQVIRLWVQDLSNGNTGNLSLANPQPNIIIPQGGNWTGSFSVTVPGAVSGDTFIFWFETARGNQFTLQQSSGGTVSPLDFYKSLSEVLGDFLPDYNSVQWAQIDENTGVVIGQWHTGWELPTTETATHHGIMTVWKVDMTYYGNDTITIGPNTCLSWTPLNAHDRETDEPFLCYIVNFTGNQISDFPLSGMQITPSPSGKTLTLYFGAEDEFSTGPAPMNPIPSNYPYSNSTLDRFKTFFGMEDEDEISNGASMTLNIYAKSPDNYAQSFPLYIVGTRTYSISINPVSGNVGSTVTVTGTGFKHSSGMTLAYDGVTLATSPTSITSSSSGGFNATFTVPPSTAGGHVVSATDTDYNVAIATFTVTPNFVITPTQGPNGTSVTVSGTGYSANSNINLIFGGTPVSTTPTPITTDITGSFPNAVFAVPNSAAGSQFVNATDTNNNSDYATFTVVASSISLNTSSGTIGTTITVGGSNFLPNLPLTVTYDGATVAMSTSTGSGAVPSGVTFIVPPSTFGSHVVRVTDGYGNYATAPFSVSASLSLNPQTGPVGTPVTVTGQGFGALKTITITFAGSAIATSPSPITTNGSGSFVASFIVPAGSTTSSIAGAKTVQASDSASPSNSASATFTVTPAITLSPTSGNVGSTVTVSGTGYGASRTITIKYDGVTQTTSPTTVTTTNYGTFSCTFTVPASVAGLHTVTGTDSSSNVDTETFTVIPNITLNPTNGYVGSSVTVSGTGFASNKAITATFNASVTLSGTTSTGSTGSFTGAIFTVPISTAGAQTVVITDANFNSGSAAFTVNVVVQPITVTLSNSAPSATVTVNGGYPSPATFAADGNSHSITMVGGSPFTLSFSNSGNTRDGFNVSSAFSSTSSSYTASTTQISVTAYEQVSNTFSVSGVSGSGSVALTGTYLGAGSTIVTLNSGNTWSANAWSDYNTAVTFPASTSGSSERWSIGNAYSTAALIAGGNTYSQTYIHQYQQTLSYTVSGGGSPTAPTATGTALGIAYAPSLTASAVPYWFDASGSIAFSTSTGGAGEQWAPSPASISATSAHTQIVSMYHQYQQTLSYSVVDGGSPTAPTATGTALGIAYAPSLTNSATPYWFDASVSIAFSTSTGGAGEQWVPSPASLSATSSHTQIVTMYHQYQVTFAQSGLDSSVASGTVLTVNGTNVAYSGLPYTVWVNSGDRLVYAYNATVASTTAGKQFVVGTVSPVSPLVGISSSQTVTGSYTTQYKLTFAQSGLDNTATGTIVTVNSAAQTYSNLPYTTDWINSGSTVTYTYNNPVTSSTTGKQFRLNSVTGSASPITVSSPATITGNYVVQWQVTFDASSNVKGDSSATIVTVAGSAKTGAQLPYTTYYDSGSSLSYSYASAVASSSSPSTTGYIWSSTNGLGQTSQSTSFTVSAYGTVTGTFTVTTFGLDTNCEGFGSISSSGSTPITTTSMTAQANELIIIVITQGNSGSSSIRTFTISDSFGSHLVYTQRGNTLSSGSNAEAISEYYAVTDSSHTGSFTITVTPSSYNRNFDVQVFGILGANTASPFDSHTGLPYTGSSTGSSIPTVTGVSTSNANDMILGLEGHLSSTAETAGSYFTGTGAGTILNNANGEGLNVGYKTVTSTLSSSSIAFGTSVSDWVMYVDAVQRAW
jgi:hypothetical protein